MPLFFANFVSFLFALFTSGWWRFCLINNERDNPRVVPWVSWVKLPHEISLMDCRQRMGTNPRSSHLSQTLAIRSSSSSMTTGSSNTHVSSILQSITSMSFLQSVLCSIILYTSRPRFFTTKRWWGSENYVWLSKWWTMNVLKFYSNKFVRTTVPSIKVFCFL